MRKVSVSIVACLMLSACASAPQLLEPLPTPQRAKPIEAMNAPESSSIADRCTFHGFASRSLEEQGEMLRRCFDVLGPAYRDLALRHAALVEWINAE